MQRRPLYLVSIGLALLVSALHALAVYLNLYWLYPWFDVPLHLLGGAMVGLPAALILARRGYTGLSLTERTAAISLGIGVLWEVFEFRAGLTSFGSGFLFDTAFDLVADVLGAIGAAALLMLYERRA